MKKERIVYLDILRILATYAVIIIHISGSYFDSISVYTPEWSYINFWDSITRWAVPVFVMISGSLYLDVERPTNIKKHIIKIIIAFLFWSAIYATYVALTSPASKGAVTWGANFVMGHYHMWFLFMIVGIYILVPILRKICENQKIVEYFLIVSLVLTSVVPTIKSLCEICVPLLNNGVIEQCVNTFLMAYEKMNFHFTLGYTSYFVLGFYLSKKQFSPKVIYRICIAMILGFLSTIMISAYISSVTGSAYGFYDFTYINVLLESAGIFVIVKSCKMRLCDKVEKVICRLSQYTFGIYLVHALIIKLLDEYCGINALSFNTIVAVPVIAIGVFVISLIITVLLHQIPFVRRYII